MESITWVEKEIFVKDLKRYEKNPRRISEKQFKKLEKSFEEDGYHQRIICDYDLKIIGGHQRYEILLRKNIEKVKVLVPNKKLSSEQFKKINVRDNGWFGEYDLDLLSQDFEVDELLDLAVPEFLFNDNFEIDEKEKTLEEKEYKQNFLLQIEFKNELDLQEAYERLADEGFECKILM